MSRIFLKYASQRLLLFLFTISLGFSLSACMFGGGKVQGAVQSYRDGTVYMKKGAYRVGALPAYWQLEKVKYKSILFRDPETQAGIATNAYCGQNFDDAPLVVLTRHLYIGVAEQKVISQKSAMLAGREVLTTVWEGKVDGVPVRLKTAVLKKDNCLFDFYYLASPVYFEKHEADFDLFLAGFSYP